VKEKGRARKDERKINRKMQCKKTKVPYSICKIGQNAREQKKHKAVEATKITGKRR
jgi:hypothetical protein